jgi:hypothetical protein
MVGIEHEVPVGRIAHGLGTMIAATPTVLGFP